LKVTVARNAELATCFDVALGGSRAVAEMLLARRRGHRLEPMLALGVLLLQVVQEPEGLLSGEEGSSRTCVHLSLLLQLLFLRPICRHYLRNVERRLLGRTDHLPYNGHAVISPRAAVEFLSEGDGRGHLKETLRGFCRGFCGRFHRSIGLVQ
jgi:hypothetical protein